jgi:hypothetical protein
MWYLQHVLASGVVFACSWKLPASRTSFEGSRNAANSCSCLLSTEQHLLLQRASGWQPASSVGNFTGVNYSSTEQAKASRKAETPDLHARLRTH